MSFERSTPGFGTGTAVVAVISMLVVSCADFRRGDYWDEVASDDTGTAGGEEPSYAADVHPLLVTGCARCHAVGESAGHTDFVIEADDAEGSYASALPFVDVEAPDQSRLLSKMAGSGHSGGTIYDEPSSEYDTVLAWIEGGAQP